MKQVVKGLSPALFEAWKAQANEDWQPTYDALRNPEKEAVHRALLTEQGKVCCYCGTRISLQTSHVEHFRPQEGFEKLVLEYSNLHASCIRETKPNDPLRCGHAKSNEFDEAKIISPQENGCESRFIYSSEDGAIYSTNTEDLSASYMISLLCLDIDYLRNRRKEALTSVFDDEFVSSASEAELAQLAAHFRQQDQTGQLEDFGHVIARYAEQLLPAAF